MKTGDAVRVEADGKMLDGLVLLASQNEASLMIQFDGMITGHVGMMPLLRGDDGVYRSIVDGTPVTLTTGRER